MRGIVLAGGAGTRLHPMTLVVSKQLMPVYDKPMIYYPLSTLMLAGIKDILIISTPQDLPRFQELLGDGSRVGVRFYYTEQSRPEGLAQAFILGADFVGRENVALILGDNLFHAQGFAKLLQQTAKLQKGATIFGYYVRDPQRYGVVEFDNQGHALSIEEKPKKPKSHYAVPGLYFYDNQVLSFAKELKKSARGELEITDLNLAYLRNRQLTVRVLGRGTAWLDTGTPTSLLEAANFIEAVEQRQGLRLGCIEEVAFRMGYINKDQLIALGEELGKSDYGAYLKAIATEPAMHAD